MPNGKVYFSVTEMGHVYYGVGVKCRDDTQRIRAVYTESSINRLMPIRLWVGASAPPGVVYATCWLWLEMINQMVFIASSLKRSKNSSNRLLWQNRCQMLARFLFVRTDIVLFWGWLALWPGLVPKGFLDLSSLPLLGLHVRNHTHWPLFWWASVKVYGADNLYT